MFFSYARARGSVKGIGTFPYSLFICVLRHFVSFAEGESKRKMQKKYAKILVYQKKVVILHRGFVRALGACALKITNENVLVSKPVRLFETFKTLK